jgi:hypothetical protein
MARVALMGGSVAIRAVVAAADLAALGAAAEVYPSGAHGQALGTSHNAGATFAVMDRVQVCADLGHQAASS